MTRAHMADVVKGTEMDGKLPDVTFYAKKERRYEDTCWYTLSMVTALICCVPCGVVGLMNAMLAKQEAMRDNEAGYRNRVRNAKLCTVMAVVFGVVVITSVAMFCFLLTSSILEGNGYRSRIMSIRESSGSGTTQNILEELTYLNRTINSHRRTQNNHHYQTTEGNNNNYYYQTTNKPSTTEEQKNDYYNYHYCPDC